MINQPGPAALLRHLQARWPHPGPLGRGAGSGSALPISGRVRWLEGP